MKLVTLKTQPDAALLPPAGTHVRAGQPGYFDLERGVVMPLYDVSKALQGLPVGTIANDAAAGDPVRLVTDTPLPETNGQYTYYVVPEDFEAPVEEEAAGVVVVWGKKLSDAWGKIMIRTSAIQSITFFSDGQIESLRLATGTYIVIDAAQTDTDALIEAFKRSTR